MTTPKMKKAVMVWECRKCTYKHVELLEREHTPGEEYQYEGECHYCYTGTTEVYVLMEGDTGFEEAMEELR
jgi:C4-type Zn-finger protein